jgi:hypothetical protein
MTRRKPLVIRGGGVERLQVGDLLDFGKLNLGPVSQLTVVAGVVTITGSYHAIFSAANTSLNSINGGSEGDVLVIRGASTGGDIAVKDLVGNLRLAGNNTISDASDTMVLLHDGANWIELTRSNNG